MTVIELSLCTRIQRLNLPYETGNNCGQTKVGLTQNWLLKCEKWGNQLVLSIPRLYALCIRTSWGAFNTHPCKKHSTKYCDSDREGGWRAVIWISNKLFRFSDASMDFSFRKNRDITILSTNNTNHWPISEEKIILVMIKKPLLRLKCKYKTFLQPSL